MVHCTNQYLFNQNKRKTPFHFKIRVIVMAWLFADNRFWKATKGYHVLNRQIVRPSKFSTSCHPIICLLGPFPTCKGKHIIIFGAVKRRSMAWTMLKYVVITAVWLGILQKQFTAYIRVVVSLNTRQFTYCIVWWMHVSQAQISCPG